MGLCANTYKLPCYLFYIHTLLSLAVGCVEINLYRRTRTIKCNLLLCRILEFAYCSLSAGWASTAVLTQVPLLPGLPFRKRWVLKWPGFFLRRRIALCSLKRMPVLTKYHVINFWQIHWLRGKIPLTCCQEHKAAFCQSAALTLWFCCLYERSTIILVEMFSAMCCLGDNASWNCWANTVARSV